jgi:predicted  nucleic acid-binding Zn ribbon protein
MTCRKTMYGLPSCPECNCGCPSQGNHVNHKGPIIDTGYGHYECESCGIVTKVYAPI